MCDTQRTRHRSEREKYPLVSSYNGPCMSKLRRFFLSLTLPLSHSSFFDDGPGYRAKWFFGRCCVITFNCHLIQWTMSGVCLQGSSATTMIFTYQVSPRYIGSLSLSLSIMNIQSVKCSSDDNYNGPGRMLSNCALSFFALQLPSITLSQRLIKEDLGPLNDSVDIMGCLKCLQQLRLPPKWSILLGYCPMNLTRVLRWRLSRNKN